jgi:zinc D-Ala-D-Ala carboxypeptidase
MTFPTLKYFKQSDFDDPSTHSGGELMNPALLVSLDSLRGACGFPFIILSGYRSSEHNKSVGGAASSAHMVQKDGTAHAVDIKTSDSRQRYLLISNAIRAGFTRIGIGKNFVHIDNSTENPAEVIWDYYGTEQGKYFEDK